MFQIEYFIAPISALLFTVIALPMKIALWKRFFLIAAMIIISATIHIFLLEQHLYDSVNFYSSLYEILAVILSFVVAPFVSVVAFYLAKNTKQLFSLMSGILTLLLFPFYGVYLMCYVGQNCL